MGCSVIAQIKRLVRIGGRNVINEMAGTLWWGRIKTGKNRVWMLIIKELEEKWGLKKTRSGTCTVQHFQQCGRGL